MIANGYQVSPPATPPRVDDRPIFPMAAVWRRRILGVQAGHDEIAVAILQVGGESALCLDPWNGLRWIELWQLRVLETLTHPAVQARLRAHVELVQP